MTRGIAWDHLPTPYNRFDKDRKDGNELDKLNDRNQTEFSVNTNGQEFQEQIVASEIVIERNREQYLKEWKEIGTRVAFGTLCGTITGLVFSTG